MAYLGRFGSHSVTRGRLRTLFRYSPHHLLNHVWLYTIDLLSSSCVNLRQGRIVFKNFNFTILVRGHPWCERTAHNFETRNNPSISITRVPHPSPPYPPIRTTRSIEMDEPPILDPPSHFGSGGDFEHLLDYGSIRYYLHLCYNDDEHNWAENDALN